MGMEFSFRSSGISSAGIGGITFQSDYLTYGLWIACNNYIALLYTEFNSSRNGRDCENHWHYSDIYKHSYNSILCNTPINDT